MRGSTPTLRPIGTTIASAAACEFTSLEIKNSTKAYVHGYATTMPDNVVLNCGM